LTVAWFRIIPNDEPGLPGAFARTTRATDRILRPFSLLASMAVTIAFGVMTIVFFAIGLLTGMDTVAFVGVLAFLLVVDVLCCVALIVNLLYLTGVIKQP
jgi:hypothetical protein